MVTTNVHGITQCCNQIMHADVCNLHSRSWECCGCSWSRSVQPPAVVFDILTPALVRWHCTSTVMFAFRSRAMSNTSESHGRSHRQVISSAQTLRSDYTTSGKLKGVRGASWVHASPAQLLRSADIDSHHTFADAFLTSHRLQEDTRLPNRHQSTASKKAIRRPRGRG